MIAPRTSFSPTRRALVRASLLVAPMAGWARRSARAADDAMIVSDGAGALPGGKAAVAGRLWMGAPTGGRFPVRLAFRRLGSGDPVRHFATELTQELHLIAISADFGTFVHEHVRHADPDGTFRAAVALPHGGTWHLYADCVPRGMAQQVIRFDVDVPRPIPSAMPSPAADNGGYGARLDRTEVTAGQDTMLALALLRDGQPATGITPFLGVAAHVVLIHEPTLAYVHVHPSAAAQGGTESAHAGMAGMAAVMAADMADMPGMAHQHGAPDGDGPGTLAAHHAHPGVANQSQEAAGMPSDLLVHIQTPEAGRYRMWVQFMGEGQVRTLPFVLTAV